MIVMSDLKKMTKSAGVNAIKFRISILLLFSLYFHKMEKESLNKIWKYGENICRTEIQSYIALAPA